MPRLLTQEGSMMVVERRVLAWKEARRVEKDRATASLYDAPVGSARRGTRPTPVPLCSRERRADTWANRFFRRWGPVVGAVLTFGGGLLFWVGVIAWWAL